MMETSLEKNLPKKLAGIRQICVRVEVTYFFWFF